MATQKVLIMGASYGSLLASKLLFGGHDVTLICLPAEVEAINTDGIRVKMPIRGRSAPVEIHSKKLPGKISAAGPAGINPADYDLVALAMQEPQYRSAGVRELLDAVAKSKKPTMSIMNMPPLPYLKRIPGLNTDVLTNCFTDATVWANFEPGCLTLCSPDPQAIRMPDDKINVLTVTLPTNFKAARFDSEASTNILRQFQREIEAIRFDPGDGPIDLPVKLKVHNSIFVPSRSGRCCAPATIAACARTPRCRSRRRCIPTWTPRAASTIGCATCAWRSARHQTIWCRSRNTPRQRTV